MRTASLCEASLDWALRATKLRGPLIDVSLRGLAIRLNEPIPAERRVVISVSSRVHQRNVVLSGTVLRSKPTNENAFDVIVRLERSLTLDDVAVIGRTPSGGEIT